MKAAIVVGFIAFCGIWGWLIGSALAEIGARYDRTDRREDDWL